jgi:hypothetical protein
MFDFLKKKKKEPEYDVTNLSLRDLTVGFIFDYNLKSWVVKEAYTYDWGNHFFTKEYKVDSGDEVGFLHVEDDGELILTFSKPMKIRKIEEDVADEIVKNEKAPRKIHYDNELYYLDADSAGYFKDEASEYDEWDELISYEYFNEDETRIISITQWDDETIEASSGIVLKEHEISGILPGNQN